MIKFNPVISAVTYHKSGNYRLRDAQKKSVMPTNIIRNSFFGKNEIENSIYNAFISMKNKMSDMTKNIIKRVQ